MPAAAAQHYMSLRDMSPLIDLGTEAFGPFGIAAIPSDTFLLYAFGYMLLALLLGIRAFRKKDL